MIICSCNVVSHTDIDVALLYLLNLPEPPVPTPGLVFRMLSKKMNCCACAPLAVETIYARVEILERKGLICPHRSAVALESLKRLSAAKPRGTAVGVD